MRALEVARALRDPTGCTSQAAARFLEGLAAVPAIAPDDVAALTQRFAAHQRRPPPAFFGDVARHLEGSLRAGGGVSLSAAGAAVLADGFARARCDDGAKALSLACLSVAPTEHLAPQELLRFARGALDLGAQGDPGVRGFLLLKLRGAAPAMAVEDLADAGALLAAMGIFSPELSDAIQLQLTKNYSLFKLRELRKLLPHFRAWRLGTVQKKAI